jgi:tetratricopeptide (TPR) repeat protein
MADINPIGDDINFGDIPAKINALLQRGVAAYRSDHGAAEALFQEALAAAPEQLPVYFCLYKIHTYQGNLDQALNIAEEAIKVAAGQAGWSSDWREWRTDFAPGEDAARFALYTLKALAFIRLRRDEKARAVEALRVLETVDPSGLVGWPVVAALADGVA